MESKKKVKKSRLIYISIIVVLLLLQVVAWNSRSFSDAYIAYRCCNISGSAGDEYDLSGTQAFGKVLSRC